MSVYIHYSFMSYPYYQRDTNVCGPASIKFYDAGMVITDPSMVCPAGLRLRLSQAVSHLYFLRPHALILSQIEGRPLSDYHNSRAYKQATLLYFGGSTPGQDLRECLQDIEFQRRI